MAFFSVFISDLFSTIEFNFPKVDFNLLRPSYIKEKLNGIWDGVNHNKLTVTGKPSDDRPSINVDKAKSPISKMDRVGGGSSIRDTTPGFHTFCNSCLCTWTDLSLFDTTKIDPQVTLRQLSGFIRPPNKFNYYIAEYHLTLRSHLNLLIIKKLAEEQANGLATNLDIEGLKKQLRSKECTIMRITDFLNKGGVNKGVVETIQSKALNLKYFKDDCRDIASKPYVLSKVLSGVPVPVTKRDEVILLNLKLN